MTCCLVTDIFPPLCGNEVKLKCVLIVLQIRMVVCVGAATCWTSAWPCTVSSSLPATCWTNSSLYILQKARTDITAQPDDSNRALADFEHQHGIRSMALLRAAFLWLSTATGNQACTWLAMQPVAVSVKCDRQVAVCVYSCCQLLWNLLHLCLCTFPSLWAPCIQEQGVYYSRVFGLFQNAWFCLFHFCHFTPRRKTLFFVVSRDLSGGPVI